MISKLNANNAMPSNNVTFPKTSSVWLKQLGIASLYVFFGYIMQHNFTSQGIVSAVWPGSGLALAVLLIGGRRYLCGVVLGALLVNAITNGLLVWVIGATLASTFEVLLGIWLLKRNEKFSLSLNTLSDYLWLIGLGGSIACIIGAIIGTLALLILGFITPAGFFGNMLHWWMGDTLGVVLVTPFILAWWQIKPKQLTGKQLLEGLLLIGITFIAGQIVFLGWLNEILMFAPKAFVMFLFITWVAIRLGIRSTTFVLNMIATQALLSAYLKVGYFANELAETALYNYWFYMLTLSVVGMALAAYVNEIKQKELSLHESEALLREAQIISGLGSYVLDIPTGLWKSSDVLDKLFGINNSYERSVEGWLALIHPDDRAIMDDYFRNEVIEQRKAFDKEYRIIRLNDQAERWVHGLGKLEFDAKGHPLKMHGTIQDITDRYKNQLRIEQLLAEQRVMLENRLLGIITVRDRKILWANPAYEAMLGYGKGEVVGAPSRQFYVNEEDYQAMGEAYPNIENNDILRIEQHEFVRKDGQHIWLDTSASLLNKETNESLWVFVDVTERKKAEEATKAACQYSRSLIEASLDPLVTISVEGKITDVNTATEHVTGMDRASLIGSDFADYFTDPEKAREKYQQVFSKGFVTDYPLAIRHVSGKIIDVLYNATVYRDCNGNVLGVFAAARDITERKRAENELRIAATAFESQEGMSITDANNVILRVNQAFTNITGYTAEEVIGVSPCKLQSDRHDTNFFVAMWETIQRTGAWEGETWNQRKNGEFYPAHLTVTAVKGTDGIVTNYVVTLTDITQSKAAADEIERLAYYDPLTGLPNRQLLRDRLISALASSHRSGQKGALLFIDMDHFKTLNDTLGHDMGDLLLQQVAHRLESCVREGDTVARLGGDEFVVMLEDLSEQVMEAAAQTEVIAKKILAVLNQPYRLSMHEYLSTPSIGATLFNGHEQSIDDLLKQADIAMYQAKLSGRNALRFFDPQMQAGINARVTLEADLRLALAEKQFKLYYQPQVYRKHQVIGAEVLIRWEHPVRGLVPPADFIPLAEETGLILPIGQWVLETACAQIKIWEGNVHTRHLQLSVNVSARQFRQVNFVEQVTQVLRRNGINRDRLKLELTESLVLDDIDDSVRKMDALREIGVRFSMDDFGTGYSSLAYLTQLPLDQLKIDQSFVHNIGVKTTDAVIVQTIIGMAGNLGMEVIAEGVETDAQRLFLEQHDCHVCQGYLFSMPLPIEEFESLQKLS